MPSCAAAVLGVAEAERALVTDGQRHAWGHGLLVSVLVHAETGVGVVVVDQDRVRCVRGTLRWPVAGVEECSSPEVGEPVGDGEDARSVHVGGFAGVLVGLPVPSQAHGAHRHLVAAHLGGTDRDRAGRPLLELVDDPALGVQVEPPREVDGSGCHLDRAVVRGWNVGQRCHHAASPLMVSAPDRCRVARSGRLARRGSDGGSRRRRAGSRRQARWPRRRRRRGV